MGKKQSREVPVADPVLPANQPPPVLDENEKVRIICEHWLRTMILDRNSWPVELASEVLKYYFYRFQWDTVWRSKGIEVAEDGKSLTMIAYDYQFNRWKSVLSQELFSKDTTSILRWEVTVKKLGSQWAGFKMGFVDNQRSNSVHGKDFYVKNWGVPRIYCQGKQVIIHENWEFAITAGDKFKLYFDFYAKECHAYCNDEYVGMITNELPPKIYLVARMVDYGCCLECTMW